MHILTTEPLTSATDLRFRYPEQYEMERWTGRVAVVTGASSGIGAGIAKEFVKQGLVVIGIARRVERVQDLAKELQGEKGNLHAVKADLRNEKEILDAFAWIEKNTSGIDVLVNNAGASTLEDLLDGKTESWRRVFDLNVIGCAICAREAIKSMKKKGVDDGIIININSVVGHRVISPSVSMYTASKFALRALSESLHKELAASGSHIRVTNLSPGAVNTEIGSNSEMKLPDDFKFSFGLNQILEPSDIAHAAVFILSTDSRVHIPELTIQQNFELQMPTINQHT